MSTRPTAQPAAKDPIHADPGHYKVEIENENVRVLRARYGPGEKSSMHTHPASIAIALSDAHVRFTFPGGKTEEMVMKAGQVTHLEAGDHLPENLGSQPFEVIVVEMKR